MSERVPLERLLSKWRVTSRTEAQRLVRAGRVRVAGRLVTDPRAWVDPAATLEVDGRRVGAAAAGLAPVWWMLNKPRGVVTTTSDPEGRRTVMDLLAGPPPGMAPVGRLDRASAGLLLLTTDAVLADRLLDPRTHVPKEYRVKVRGRLETAALEALRRDTIEEAGLVLGPMEVMVEREGPRSTWLRVRLAEGKNRQVRRRLLAVGHEVLVLVRVAFGPLELGDLAPGAVRPLEAAEVEALARAAGRSG
jgi:23S rRNA pseudouridine2605 synthase